jgi:hypothetical protein
VPALEVSFGSTSHDEKTVAQQKIGHATKKARASTSRSSGRLFSRNSDYEEVEGEKHPPVIQPFAPLKVKPDITNHLLSNAYSG